LVLSVIWVCSARTRFIVGRVSLSFRVGGAIIRFGQLMSLPLG